MAFVLTLWCAGAGCMLVSYAHAAAPPASMEGHACCKARHAKHKAPASRHTQLETASTTLRFEQVELAEMPPESGAMSCCPLSSGSFVVSARSQAGDDNDEAASGNNKQVALLNDSQPTPPVYPLRLPNQNQTYLRGCAFLI